MDSYEATRVVLSRIQALDPENASKIMGFILIQDHGEKEMIRLAFGPEALLHSVVLKARKDLGLLPLSRQNSAPRLLSAPPPPPLSVSSPSWASSQSPFSRSNGSGPDDLQNPDELHSPAPFYGAGAGAGAGPDLMDEFQLQDQLSFLNEQGPTANPMIGGAKSNELYLGDIAAECRSPGAGSDGLLFPYSMGWGGAGENGNHHRRSCSVADLCLGSDTGFGWKPCLYFARGYCKNGSSCRFLHGMPDDAAGRGKMDAAVEQQCHELLMRSKSQRASQLMASAFPYSPTGSVMPASPSSSSSKCMSFLMQQQQQQSESQRAAAAALMLGGEDAHKFMGRARMESRDFGGLINPGSRQIYLTFPADSTFREEDVSNYFSIYGPVQDVRIPYQQKRMFGFVTFVYPETVKLILAKGNPHFVCDARVLVKPYKEKGKVPDKKQPTQQGERGDFSLCTTPTGMESRDPYDLQQLVSPGAGRMLYSSSTGAQEALLRRRLEEQQQQAAELQQAIELQGRRFMGLQLLDLKARTLASHLNSTITSAQEEAPLLPPPPPPTTTEDKTGGSAAGAAEQQGQQMTVNGGGADREEFGGERSPNEDSDFPESSAEHNLPDSPFASPTRSSFARSSFSTHEDIIPQMNTPFKSCFFPIPRFSGHGAIGM